MMNMKSSYSISLSKPYRFAYWSSTFHGIGPRALKPMDRDVERRQKCPSGLRRYSSSA